jgi:hypothetical protein
MDQRKVNMLAREYCDATSPKIKFKPIILSHREWAQPARLRAARRAAPRGRAPTLVYRAHARLRAHTRRR